MKSPNEQLKNAIATRLEGETVYDAYTRVPDDTKPQYYHVNGVASDRMTQKGRPGRECVVSVDMWSMKSAGTAVLDEMLDAATQAITDVDSESFNPILMTDFEVGNQLIGTDNDVAALDDLFSRKILLVTFWVFQK